MREHFVGGAHCAPANNLRVIAFPQGIAQTKHSQAHNARLYGNLLTRKEYISQAIYRSSNKKSPHPLPNTAGYGDFLCYIVILLRQYRIILSADTASEVRQLLSQKRR